MPKRIRRDLSNPSIKRIIREQTATGVRKGFSSKSNKSRSKKPFYIWLVVLITAGAAAFYFLSDQFADGLLPSSPNEVPEITETQEPQSPVETTTAQNIPPEPEPEIKSVARRVQVEILNGCGVDGLAERLTRYLRKYDIDVVSRGNYRHFEVPASRIVDRVNNAERIDPLGKLLGIASNKIVVEENVNLQLDATIVLGLDYKSLKPFKE